MAIFNKSFSQSKSQATETVITPTFFPLSWVQQYTMGLSADDKKFLELFLSVPELQAVINTKASAFVNMRVMEERGEDEVPCELPLFQKANAIQSFKEFAFQYYVLRAIFGNSFIHPVYGAKPKYTKALWNLPPLNAKVIPVESKLIPFNMTDLDEIIKGYEFTFQGKKIPYEPNEIIHYNDNQVLFDDDKWLLGDSHIRAITGPCENIKAAYEARGRLITNSVLGVLANDSSDANGTAPLLPKDKKDLHEDFDKYGLTKQKWHVIITNAALRWQSMATDIGKLKLIDEVEADFEAIARQHRFPPEILLGGVKYENKQQAEKQLYQNAVIPEANEFLKGLELFLEYPYPLKADYSHVAALQSDKEKSSRSMSLAATGLSKAVEGGFLKTDEAEAQFKKYMI